jgi:hypothetical protein
MQTTTKNNKIIQREYHLLKLKQQTINFWIWHILIAI